MTSCRRLDRALHKDKVTVCRDPQVILGVIGGHHDVGKVVTLEGACRN